ncbi:Glutamate receptor [Portunus trituberculatus]|uniref:Glutamate receptor n=1 Tax=Portunus trituberculatus TaxID=210409 RepID=A0A5B7DSV6_PORTR|nr:Glutamate receptor [Portunus trituberculatus]
MMGQLMTGQADFALGPFVTSRWREAVADLTASFYYINYHVITPRPVVPSDPAGIVKTFSLQVWLSVAASLAVVGVAMMGMMWVGNKFQWNTKVVPACGRVLVAVWLLSALVITTTYKGNITAMLTLPKTNVPIDSIADLANQDRLPWKLEFGGIDKLMMESEDKATQKVGREVSGFIPSCWSGREAIRAGEFASVCDTLTIRSIMSWDFSMTGRCHFYMAKHRLQDVRTLSLLFPPGSIYFATGNELVLRLTEAGLWDEWLGRELANATECLKSPSADRGSGVKPLGLVNMLGVMVLLAAGYLVSVLAFAEEKLHLGFSSF